MGSLAAKNFVSAFKALLKLDQEEDVMDWDEGKDGGEGENEEEGEDLGDIQGEGVEEGEGKERMKRREVEGVEGGVSLRRHKPLTWPIV